MSWSERHCQPILNVSRWQLQYGTVSPECCCTVTDKATNTQATNNIISPSPAVVKLIKLNSNSIILPSRVPVSLFQRIRGFTTMRYINRLFTYLFTSMIPPQQHLYNGIACPADYYIFTREWTSLCWHRNGLARTDTMLAYDHRGWRGWPTASLLAYVASAACPATNKV